MFKKDGEITSFNKHTEHGYTRSNTETNTFNGSYQHQNQHQHQNQNQHQHQRSRFKEFRNIENKRPEISQEEYNEKYGFANAN